MSNLANNHNKVSSSHAQSAGNEKEKFYLINWATKLYETCEIHVLIIQEQLDFAHKNCSFMGRYVFVP